MALAEIYLLYSGISGFWKWVSFITAPAVTGLIVYSKDRKKSSVFTAVGIVLLAAVVMRLLELFGLF